MPVLTHYLIVFQYLSKNFRATLLVFGLNSIFLFLFFYPFLQLLRLFPSPIGLTGIFTKGFSSIISSELLEQNTVFFNLILFVFLILIIGYLSLSSFIKGGILSVYNSGGAEVSWKKVFSHGILFFWQNLLLKSFSFILLASTAFLFYWFLSTGKEQISYLTSSSFINLIIQYSVSSLLIIFSLSLWLYYKLAQASLLHHQSAGFIDSCKQSFYFFKKYPLRIYSTFLYFLILMVCIAVFFNLYLFDLMSQSLWKLFFFSQFLLFIVIYSLSVFEGVIFILTGTHKLESSYAITSSSKAFMRVLPKEEFDV